MRKTFNGHINWEYWNVSLWIANDESLYRLARRCILTSDTKTEAAQDFLDRVQNEKTPDGAVYTLYNVRAAFKDLI